MQMMLATVVMRLGVRPMVVLVAPSTILLPMLLPMLLCGGNESMVVRVLRGALGVSRLDDVSRFLQQSLTWFQSLRLTTYLFEILRFWNVYLGNVFRISLFSTAGLCRWEIIWASHGRNVFLQVVREIVRVSETFLFRKKDEWHGRYIQSFNRRTKDNT